MAYVGHELEQNGTIDDAGDPSHLLFAFSGDDKVRFRGPLRATVVAPRAGVELEELRATAEHQGAVIARAASLGERTTLRHVLFAHWGLLLQPRPVLECVSAFTTTAFNALFGYDNQLDIPLSVPHGPHNQVEPSGDGVPRSCSLRAVGSVCSRRRCRSPVRAIGLGPRWHRRRARRCRDAPAPNTRTSPAVCLRASSIRIVRARGTPRTAAADHRDALTELAAAKHMGTTTKNVGAGVMPNQAPAGRLRVASSDGPE